MRAPVQTAADADDFRAWVAPHLLAMSRLASRLTSDADADDVVQEALVRAWRKRSIRVPPPPSNGGLPAGPWIQPGW